MHKISIAKQSWSRHGWLHPSLIHNVSQLQSLFQVVNKLSELCKFSWETSSSSSSTWFLPFPSHSMKFLGAHCLNSLKATGRDMRSLIRISLLLTGQLQSFSLRFPRTKITGMSLLACINSTINH